MKTIITALALITVVALTSSPARADYWNDTIYGSGLNSTTIGGVTVDRSFEIEVDNNNRDLRNRQRQESQDRIRQIQENNRENMRRWDTERRHQETLDAIRGRR